MLNSDFIRTVTPTLPDMLVGWLVGMQGKSELFYVAPFPEKSWLYTGEPYGWQTGTDRWTMFILPLKEDDVLVWVYQYSDDEGNNKQGVADPESLSEVIRTSVMPV